jgi:CheY-like chemotaxis protein
MHKILIVDDIATNRRVLKLILSELDNIEFYDAENGEIAIEKVNTIKPDIIFMDIMMPVMDGIEATKAIKSDPKNSNIFIFAITALDDQKVKAEMLDAGASDFVNKPFDDEELILRTQNYLRLLDQKEKIVETRKQHPSINTYNDTTLSNMRTVLHIQDVLDLESILHFFDGASLYPKSHYNDITTMVITIASVLFKANKLKPFDVIFEHSENYYYLTIWNELFSKATHKYFDKFNSNIETHYIDDKLSFRIEREDQLAELLIKAKETQEHVTPSVPAPTQQISTPKEKTVHDFIEAEDLHEIEDNLQALNSNLMLFSNGSLEDEDFNQISGDLDSIAKALQFYPQISQVAGAIIELSDALHSYREGFLKNARSLAPLFMGFGNDLEIWIDSLFYSGTTDLHFLDSTFQSNCDMIVNFAKDEEAHEAEEELDDIFDF